MSDVPPPFAHPLGTSISQLLIPTSICFLVGLVIGELVQFIPVTIFVTFLAFLVVLAILERRSTLSRLAGTLFFGALLLGTCLTVSSLHTTYSQTIASLERTGPITAIGQVHGAIRHGPNRNLLYLNVMRVKLNDQWHDFHGKLRLSVRHLNPDISPGDVIQVETKIRRAHGLRNPGGFDYATFLIRHGITATAWADGRRNVVKVAELGNPVWRQVHRWREEIRQAALNSLEGPSLAIYLAMIIGESGYLTHDIRDNFMASGTTHILSISGSHLALVAIIVFGCVRWGLLRLPKPWLLRLTQHITPTKCAAFATIPPVLFYSALAGGEVPTIRSLIMILIGLLAVLAERPHAGQRALALAALCILTWDPLAVFDISFQLSFLSVLTILLVVYQRRKDVHATEPTQKDDSDHSEPWLRLVTSKLLKSTRTLLVISAAVTITTLPLVAYHFHQIPWAGVLGNLLVVPFSGFVVIPVGLTTAVWVLLTDRSTLPLEGLVEWSFHVFYAIATLFTHIPYAEYHVASPSTLSILVFYAAMALTLWMWREPFPSPKAHLRTIAAGVALITVVLWTWSPYAEPPDGEIRVTYLDVGQGDAILIQLPGPKVILVDGGAGPPRLDMGRAVTAPYLWDQGIAHIDLMVVTHPQLDHMGGLSYILRQFSVGEIWNNGESRDAEFYRTFTTELAHGDNRKDIQQQVKRGDTQVPIGPCDIHILNPGTTYHSQNDHSIVFRLSCRSHSFLLTGDIESDTIHDLSRHPTRNRARVLKVPHHGAATSIDVNFLKQVNPEFAVVSVGKYNRYGHPSPEMLAVYSKLKIPVYRTDRDGAIIVQTMGQHLALTRTVDLSPRPINWGNGMLQQELRNLRLLAPRLGFWSRPTV